MNNMKYIITIFLLITSLSQAQTLAFDGDLGVAMGAGAYATGGRGGKICHVNTLQWDTALVYDATTDTYSGGLYNVLYELDIPARIIVFDVSGTIDVNTGYMDYTYTNTPGGFINGTSIERQYKGNITISGQTSPGKIVLATSQFVLIGVENVIWRYTSFYNDGTASGKDVFQINSHQNSDTYPSGSGSIAYSERVTENIIFDQCSFFYGGDECFGITGKGATTGYPQGNPVTNNTIQNCLMAASSKGAILGSYNGTDNENSMIRCAFIDIAYRFPNLVGYGNSQGDAVNNYIENYSGRLIRATGSGVFNVQNFFVKPNPKDYGKHRLAYEYSPDNPRVWSEGMIIEGVKDIPTSPDFDMWLTFDGSAGGADLPLPADAKLSSAPALLGAPYTVYDAEDLITDVVPYVGNTKRLDENGNIVSDEYDLDTFYKDLLINHVPQATQTTRFPTVKYADPTSGTPYTDTDKDGMPDAWEITNGLNENVNDSADYDLSVTYTNVEMFINASVTSDIPVITLVGNPTVNLNLNDSYTDAGATATDLTDGDITANIAVTGTVDTSIAGTYYLYFNVSDSESNAAIQKVRTIIVTDPSDTEAPTQPMGLTASNVTSTNATINWVASTDNVAIASYKVYKDAVLTSTVTGGVTYNATGLSANTSYDFTVIAVDTSGNESLVSSTLSVTTLAASVSTQTKKRGVTQRLIQTTF